MNKKLFLSFFCRILQTMILYIKLLKYVISRFQGYVMYMYVTKMCKMTFEGQRHTANIVIGPKGICKHSLSYGTYLSA